MFKLQISLDRHNTRLKFNYCLRFDQRHFSLPSTFNIKKTAKICRNKQKFIKSMLFKTLCEWIQRHSTASIVPQVTQNILTVSNSCEWRGRVV
jgi:hypothetical protein